MIWLVLALIGAGTFFVTGFNLLTDPLCVSADFGGGRVVQVTCRSDEFGTVSGTQAGLISILIGLGILTFIFWRPIKALFIQNKLLREVRSQSNEDITDISMSDSVSDFQSDSSSPTKKCPKCAEDIKAEAIKCRFCGSDLGPKGVEKTNLLLGNFVKKYPPKNHVFEIMALTLVVVAAVIFISIQTTKTRELSALKVSGQVCVFNQDKSIDFGCADYPQLKIKVCTVNKYVDWSARIPEYTFLSESYDRSQGQITYACDGETPYLYSLDYALPANLRVGEYEIFGTGYKYINGYDRSDDDYVSNLVLEVSLK